MGKKNVRACSSKKKMKIRLFEPDLSHHERERVKFYWMEMNIDFDKVCAKNKLVMIKDVRVGGHLYLSKRLNKSPI